MYKSVGVGDRLLQIVTTLGGVIIGFMILNYQKTHLNVENIDSCDDYNMNFSNCTNFGLLIKDPPETEYVVLKALDNKVSSDALMANMATLLSDKLAAHNENNVENTKDLTKFIPHILEYGNEVISVKNKTLTTYVDLLTGLLEEKEILHFLSHKTTNLEKIISLKICDSLQNNNIDDLLYLNPFVKIGNRFEYNVVYSSNLINLMVKSAVYEYIEKMSLRFGKFYGLWWKERVSNAVVRIFTMNMENVIVSAKNLVSFGKELESTLISLGQFIFLDVNQDGRLSSDELMNIFAAPNVETEFPFIFSLFKVATYRYGFTINLIEFIIFKFSLRITDDIASAKLSNIVRL